MNIKFQYIFFHIVKYKGEKWINKIQPLNRDGTIYYRYYELPCKTRIIVDPFEKKVKNLRELRDDCMGMERVFRNRFYIAILDFASMHCRIFYSLA